MLIRRAIAATAMAASVVALAASTAFAAEEPDDPANGVERQVAATYNGRTIILGEGWQGAAICTEVAEGDMRCYDTAEDEQRDLPDESLGHALAAEAAGLNVPNALSTEGLKPPALTEIAPDKANSSANGPATGVGIQALADCTGGYACVFDNTDYTGRILKFISGAKNLGDYDFRDKSGSACNNKNSGGFEVTDFRTGLPDPLTYVPLTRCVRFNTVEYTYGGDWNNKADRISL
ncbi:peptidase inhibitor family I36 protein [Streptomyces sp. TE33382]